MKSSRSQTWAEIAGFPGSCVSWAWKGNGHAGASIFCIFRSHCDSPGMSRTSWHLDCFLVTFWGSMLSANSHQTWSGTLMFAWPASIGALPNWYSILAGLGLWHPLFCPASERSHSIMPLASKSSRSSLGCSCSIQRLASQNLTGFRSRYSFREESGNQFVNHV